MSDERLVDAPCRWVSNLDLPVGIHPYGADAWMFQQELANGFTIGAPPDWFNRYGQNWELVAPLPAKMRTNHYQFFIETIRHNMRHGGVLRLDHALGLFRLFVIPDGGSGKEGTYLRFPVDELLAIVALESVRNRVVVVGEDLGTVTPSIKKRLAQAGLLSYRVLLFEKTANGGFRSPDQYPENALVSATTHDLPTLHGFWIGRDIEVKARIGFYSVFTRRCGRMETACKGSDGPHEGIEKRKSSSLRSLARSSSSSLKGILPRDLCLPGSNAIPCVDHSIGRSVR